MSKRKTAKQQKVSTDDEDQNKIREEIFEEGEADMFEEMTGPNPDFCIGGFFYDIEY
jgi:hypothetical protein